MLSIRNVAGSAADIVGSHLADHKWPFGSLVFLNAGTTANPPPSYVMKVVSTTGNLKKPGTFRNSQCTNFLEYADADVETEFVAFDRPRVVPRAGTNRS